MRIYFIIVLFFFSSIVQAQQLDSCYSDALAQEKSKRMEAFKSMYVPGNKMHELALNGNLITKNNANKTVVVFWKTDCPYCKNLLQVLEELLSETAPQDVQVVAVCVDSDTSAWQNHAFVKLPNSNLLNLCDGKGYFGEIPTALNIYATPTMLVVDKDGCFMKLPKNVAELKEMIKSKK